ncbi:MAG: hypothetical protein FWD17_08400 [Polyangiaceae bacterium]|nr:hypothetical protein [Polyangiaceae bacterium]
MHGVPKDLPLDAFVGQMLNQIALGRFQTQLRFERGDISIEGGWELTSPDGQLIDRAQDHAARDCYRIHRILDLPVSRFEIDAPASFTLIFEPGYRFTVFDDSEHYESFSVNIDGRPGVYV